MTRHLSTLNCSVTELSGRPGLVGARMSERDDGISLYLARVCGILGRGLQKELQDIPDGDRRDWTRPDKIGPGQTRPRAQRAVGGLGTEHVPGSDGAAAGRRYATAKREREAVRQRQRPRPERLRLGVGREKGRAEAGPGCVPSSGGGRISRSRQALHLQRERRSLAEHRGGTTGGALRIGCGPFQGIGLPGYHLAAFIQGTRVAMVV